MSADGNVVELLREAAAAVPERAALACGSGPTARRLGYGELWRRASACAAGLRARGLEPGDRAVVMAPMSFELYVLLLGVIQAGAAAVFVDPWVPARRIAAFCRHAQPKAFLGVARSHLLRLLEPELLRIPVTVTTGRRLGRWPARWTLAELEAEPGDGAIAPRADSDSALITFTSGSSGEPKGADRSHGFLRAQRRALEAAFGPPPTGVDLPLFPVFALANLAARACSVIPDVDFRRVENPDAARLLEQMRFHGVGSCTASPAFLDQLAERALQAQGEAPELRRILAGGAPVGDDQLRLWRRAFPAARILVVYGSTEVEPVAHLDLEERLALAGGGSGVCMGRPVAGLRARILELRPPAEGAPPPSVDAPPGDIGELALCGEHVCRGYFRNPAADREHKFVDGDGRLWHRMGDTGRLDGEGRFWLAGRVHSTVFAPGGTRHAALVEAAARRLFGPGQYAALGVGDPANAQRLLLAARPASGSLDPAAAMGRMEEAGERVDEVRVLRRPLPLDPRHRSKIDHRALRRRLGLDSGGRP